MIREQAFIGDIKVKKVTTSSYSLVEATSLKELLKKISSVIQYMVVDFEERGVWCRRRWSVKRKLSEEN